MIQSLIWFVGYYESIKVLNQKALDEIVLVQSWFYNGWKLEHYVSVILCFEPDGTITTGFNNVPGCCHDSKIADWGEGGI